MSPISFSAVNARKRALANFNPRYEKISFRTVNRNLNEKNLLLFIESGSYNEDTHCKQSFSFYNTLLKESKVSKPMQLKIESGILNNLSRVSDLDSVSKLLSSSFDNIPNKEIFFNSLDDLESCDRVIRNESKLEKRFNFQKIINENIGYGLRHTVFELCSLLDTYDISSKAKMNIALENISYSLFKSGHKINLTESTEYIVEYFLTRDAIITDKDYNGYIDVLENNSFIDKKNPNIAYIFEAKNTKGNSYKDKLEKLIAQCESNECKNKLKEVLSIKNEKQASKYIDDTIQMIISDKYSKIDSTLLLKSIYIIPLIGNVSKQFINYKIEMSRKRLKIKNKVSDMQNKKMINDLLDDGELIDAAAFVSENTHFENYILDDNYKAYKEPINYDIDSYLEGVIKDYVKDAINTKPEKDDSEDIDKIINAFKASNEKSPSKFKNMLNRLMTKSPSEIINKTPSIFKMVRAMIYIGVSAAFPLGPVFAGVAAFINSIITKHLDLKEAEKLLKYLKSEKESAEKKLEKLSDKEKDTQKEYIKTLDKCIDKVKEAISDIDDDNEALQSDDGDDDFDDFSWESALLESGSIINSASKELLNMISSNIDENVLLSLSEIFDNCSSSICESYYNKIEEIMNESIEDGRMNKTCKSILENRGNGRLFSNEEPGFIAQYEANLTIQEIVNEANQINNKKKKGNFLATVKMATLNFKKKVQNLNAKQQELWRNIDICTNRLTTGIQQALTSDRREAIIKGSIIPSFSKCIKYAISVGAVGAFTGPVGAVITAVGLLGASKILNERERKLLYDEIDTELQVVEKQIQLAENDGDMNQYRFLLNYQKKLQREKYRIKYGVRMQGRNIPEINKGGND